MKTLFGFLALLTLTGCDDCTRPNGGDGKLWALRDDMMNLGVLVVSTDTHELHGANVSHFESCSNCYEEDSPFLIAYDRGDPSYVVLSHRGGQELFFQATLGGPNRPGEILIPDTLLAPQHFVRLANSVPYPNHAEYLSLDSSELTLEEFQAESRETWEDIADLDVVAAFAERPHAVGFYLYRWGYSSDKDVWSWVIFLYAGAVDDT